MSRKVFKWLTLGSIYVNNLIFILVYHMNFIDMCIVDLILYVSCSIAYRKCFPEQIKKEREELMKQYEEILKNHKDEV